MSLPFSGPISFGDINIELGRTYNHNASLMWLETGWYVPLNSASPYRPSGNSPFSMAEWRGYDHNYSAYDVDALAFINAAGLTVTAQKDAINDLVIGLKNYGIWNKMYAIYPFIGGSAFTHKWNLKDPRDLDAAFRLVFYGGLTHSSTGVDPNGITGYADTFFTPSTTISQSNAISLGVYIRNNYIDSVERMNMNCAIFSGGMGGEIGIHAGFSSSIPSAAFSCDLDNSTTYYSRRVAVDDIIEGSVRDTRGFWVGSQDVVGMGLFKNGTSVSGSYLGNKIANRTTPNVSLVMFAQRYNTSTIRRFSKHELAFSFIGQKLTSTEAYNYNYLVDQFQATLGRNI